LQCHYFGGFLLCLKRFTLLSKVVEGLLRRSIGNGTFCRCIYLNSSHRHLCILYIDLFCSHAQNPNVVLISSYYHMLSISNWLFSSFHQPPGCLEVICFMFYLTTSYFPLKMEEMPLLIQKRGKEEEGCHTTSTKAGVEVMG
jgi:hypothetical protein